MGGFAGRAVSPSLVLVSDEKETLFFSFESSDFFIDPLVFGEVEEDGSSESLKRRFFLGGSLDVEPLALTWLFPFIPLALGSTGASSFAYFSFRPSFFQAGIC